MSRVFLKNDIFRFEVKPKEAEKKKPNDSSKEEKIKEDKSKVPNVDWSSMVQIGLQPTKKKTLEELLAEQEEKQNNQQQEKPKQQKQEKEILKTKTSIINFKPIATLKIESPPKKQDSQETQKPREQQNKEQKPKRKAKQRKTRDKKINKDSNQPNLVRLDLKRRYGDRFVGGILKNKRMYMRNGQLKPKYRKKQADNEALNSQSYDIYIQSISKALYITLDLDEQSHLSQKVQVKGRSKQQLTELIGKIWGFSSFRYGQYEVIDNVMRGISTLFVSQTGSGKSLCYILSSMLMEGLSIVVSPLVSLMLDQIESIPQQLPAACISSLLNPQQKERIMNMVKENKIKLLFLTPEALQSDFVFRLRDIPPVNFVCVDEAHCVSELSHNFRTTYLIINDLINRHFKFRNGKNILCLTATANNKTIQSIVDKMQLKEVIRSDSLRPKNLCITISRDPSDVYRALIDYLRSDQIVRLKGILVYCRTRKISGQVLNYLTNCGFSVAMYNAGLQQKQKTQLLQSFRQGNVRIVVATIALGMGLDFEHLDCVIHMSMPKSLESYVQEMGRAGRRGRRAYCHMFLNVNDYFTERNYILAASMERDNLTDFIRTIEKITNNNPKKLKQPELKRDYGSDEQLQELKKEMQNSRINSELCMIRQTALAQMVDLKPQAIITILLKMQKLSKKNLIQILPPSHEILKISFYSKNHDKMRQQNEFYRKITQDIKMYKGSIHIRLIDRCNQLNMDPVDIISRLHQVSQQYYFKIEYEHDVIVWRNVGRMTFSQFIQNNFVELITELEELEKGALLKLNILYTLAFLNSSYSINEVLRKSEKGKERRCISEERASQIADLFDKYFTSDPKLFYEQITKGDHYVPTWELTEKDKQEIYHATMGFLREEMNNCGLVTQTEMLRKHRSGRIISRILMGASTEGYSWMTYGKHPSWMRFKDREYDEVRNEVREAVREFTEKHAQKDEFRVV